MKRFLYLLLALLTLGFGACSDDKTAGTEAALLTVTPDKLEFDAAADSRLVELTTTAGSWSLTQPEQSTWCSPELRKGRTSTSFHIAVEANEGEERSVTLTFTAPGCEPVPLTVTQRGDAASGSESVVAEPDAWDNVKRAGLTYQVLVYSFADGDGDTKGDLKGLLDKLDYFDRMGVAALWLSPIHPSSSYHGYDVLDYTAVNPAFGTEADLQALIDAAHARGIKVYLDYVLNHTGKEHPWFRDAAASEQSPYRDYYIFSGGSTRSPRRARPATTAGSGSRPTRGSAPRGASASSWTGPTRRHPPLRSARRPTPPMRRIPTPRPAASTSTTAMRRWRVSTPPTIRTTT